MTESEVRARLADTGIRVAGEADVPVNGVTLPLPYLIIRCRPTIDGSDNGRVTFTRIEWEVALFTVNYEPELVQRVVTGLQGCGKIQIVTYPDGDPYQTTFKFKTFQT